MRVPGVKPFYLAWGHPSENNISPEKGRAVIAQVWDSGIPLLFHNSKFDYDVGITHLKLPELPWQRIHDTLFLIFLQDPDRATLALKEVAQQVLDLPPNERDAVRAWLIEHGVVAKNDRKWGAWISKAPGKLVGRYAIGDVDRTWLLFKKYYEEVVVTRSMGEAYDRERKLMPVLLRSEQRGLAVDLKGLDRDLPRYEKALELTDAWIRKRLKSKELSVDSNEELAEAILRAGAADESKWARTEKTNQLSTSKAALTEAITDKSLSGALHYRGGVATCVRTFMRPWWLTARDTRGVIYTSWNQVAQDYHDSGARKGARTGRLSSVPSLMNIPTNLDEKAEWVAALTYMRNNPQLRLLLSDYPVPQVRSYVVPRKGMVLLDRDYSQQEFRILAHYEDGALLLAYQEDPWVDMHEFVQKAIIEILGLHIDRKPIKVLNFGLVYGMGVGKLARGMGKSVDEARLIKGAHKKGFPGIKDLSDDLKERADRGEPIRTWGGREYFCEPSKEIDGRTVDFAYKLLNTLIQGSAADNTKEAMINYDERKGPGSHLELNVHDELMAEAPEETWREEMRQLRDAMSDVKFDLPMLSEGRWSKKRWTEMTDLPRGE